MTNKAIAAPILIASLMLGLAAPATAAPPQQRAEFVRASFAERLGKNQEPIDRTDAFEPMQPINLSLMFKGRPVGVVTGEFYFHDQLISDATIDMAKMNAGKAATAGQNTYVGFTLTPDQALPISANGYRVDVFLDDKPLDTFTFSVVPPAGALPTRIVNAELAAGSTKDYQPIDPTTTFTPTQPVYLVGEGDFGTHSWMEVRWFEDGELKDEGTRSITLEEDKEAAGFNFFFLPEGGWKEGEHEVALIVNDEEVSRFPFTVSNEASPAPQAGVVQIDSLEPYEQLRKVFTIDAPSNWERSENNSNAEVNTTWVAPDGNGFIFVSVAAAKPRQTLKQLGDLGAAYIEREFGGETAFEMQDSEELSDDVVGISWAAEPEIDGQPLAIEAITLVRQDGDKVSKLTLVLPKGYEDDELSAAIEQIVRSFTVNPSARF